MRVSLNSVSLFRGGVWVCLCMCVFNAFWLWPLLIQSHTWVFTLSASSGLLRGLSEEMPSEVRCEPQEVCWAGQLEWLEFTDRGRGRRGEPGAQLELDQSFTIMSTVRSSNIPYRWKVLSDIIYLIFVDNCLGIVWRTRLEAERQGPGERVMTGNEQVEIL